VTAMNSFIFRSYTSPYNELYRVAG
jgi:hypothetical protein